MLMKFVCGLYYSIILLAGIDIICDAIYLAGDMKIIGKRTRCAMYVMNIVFLVFAQLCGWLLIRSEDITTNPIRILFWIIALIYVNYVIPTQTEYNLIYYEKRPKPDNFKLVTLVNISALVLIPLISLLSIHIML